MTNSDEKDGKMTRELDTQALHAAHEEFLVHYESEENSLTCLEKAIEVYERCAWTEFPAFIMATHDAQTTRADTGFTAKGNHRGNRILHANSGRK